MDNKFKVVVHSVLVNDPDIEKEIFKDPAYEIVFIPDENVDGFSKTIVDADALIIADKKINQDTINSLKKCKIIARQGIGVDNIDLATAKEKGIMVTNVPDYCIAEVSDFTMSLIFAITRNLTIYDRHVKDGVWDIKSPTKINGMPAPRRYSTQTLGIVSFGKIAKEVARKSKAFGLNILVYDPYADTRLEEEYGVKFVDFLTLVKESDIIAINAPLTLETKHLFNMDVFKQMKNTAYIVNTSRGPLINEEDLYVALRDKIIAGAAVDVTIQEPPIKDSPLLSLDNLIIAPHAAFYTEDSYNELRTKAASEVKKVLMNEEPLYRVNK